MDQLGIVRGKQMTAPSACPDPLGYNASDLRAYRDGHLTKTIPSRLLRLRLGARVEYSVRAMMALVGGAVGLEIAWLSVTALT